MLKAKDVKKDLFWVGVLDYDIRVFDIIMYTDYGTTYNSYILKGSEKTALFEVVKEGFFDEFLERMLEVSKPEEIDYIVLNHTEPDHSGSLKRLLEICVNAKVVSSTAGNKFIKAIANRDFDEIIVKDGDEISLGNYNMKFIMAPFLHWPDTMFTYVSEIKTLFTCDSFGCHYCDDKVFNDKIDGEFTTAYKYYFDHIIGPFKSYALSAIEKIKDFEIETICNGHGPVIRENPWKYIEMYKQWATVVPPAETSVVIVYATAYGYTKLLAETMANKMQELAKAAGVKFSCKLFDVVEQKDRTAIFDAIIDAQGILFGCPTLVGDVLPPINEILAGLNPTIHKGKLAGAFGSYGWSGEAVPHIEQRLAQLKLKMPVAGLKIQFNPSESELIQTEQFAQTFFEAILKL